jgi:hypothetical protein
MWNTGDLEQRLDLLQEDRAAWQHQLEEAVIVTTAWSVLAPRPVSNNDEADVFG